MMGRPLNIHCFMHVPFEGPGAILRWIKRHHHQLEFTRFYKGDPLPEADPIDLLVMMGGPMNVYDFHVHPWMQEEIEWVTAFIGSRKPLIGICLGAQIIATSLGSEVLPGEQREIGWHNLHFLPALGDYRICRELPSSRKVFHWHGDTFQIPAGATRIAESQAFASQGFIYDGRVVAFQFHLEVTPEGVRKLTENCRDDLVPGPYIQTGKEILEEKRFFRENQELMFRFLDYLSSLVV